MTAYNMVPRLKWHHVHVVIRNEWWADIALTSVLLKQWFQHMISTNMSRGTAFHLAPITNIARESYIQANGLCCKIAYDANVGGVYFPFTLLQITIGLESTHLFWSKININVSTIT